jgi:hypothetical protein
MIEKFLYMNTDPPPDTEEVTGSIPVSSTRILICILAVQGRDGISSRRGFYVVCLLPYVLPGSEAGSGSGKEVAGWGVSRASVGCGGVTAVNLARR